MPVFVILKREVSEEIRFIPDRRPLIIPEEYVDEWIRPGTKPEELLDFALTEKAEEIVIVTDKPENAETPVQLSMEDLTEE